MEITCFLLSKFPFRSADTWKKRLDLEWITQDGKPLFPGDRVRAEPPLNIYHPRFIEPSVPDEVAILEQNADYILAFKPAPMPMHPGGRYNRNTFISILQAKTSTDENFENQSNCSHELSSTNKARTLRIIHRLDATTSGLVLTGHNPGFSREVQRLFYENQVKKRYLAHVSGTPSENEVYVDRPIKRKNGYIFECHPNGKDSLTRFHVLKRMDTSSLVCCEPVTGRTHQIRLHLSEWGYPVIDDPVYGSDCGLYLRNMGSDYLQPLQNTAISLIHYQLGIPSMKLDFNLLDYIDATVIPFPG